MSGLDNIAGLLRSGYANRKGLTDLTGCTHVSLVNTSVEIVSAAANINGVVIRFVNLSVSPTSGNSTVALDVDGNEFIRISGDTSNKVAIVERDIFIPAGKSIESAMGTNGCILNMDYEVL